MTIRFHRVRDPNGELSNHSAYGFELDDLFWPTFEHYYQARSLQAHPALTPSVRLPDPWTPSVYDQTTDLPLRPDWDEVKEDVLFRATLAKYETHADVRAVLLATDGVRPFTLHT